MRAVVATAVACFSLVGFSIAADVQASVRKDISIPAGGLAPALQAFSEERYINVVFLSEDVSQRLTRGATGSLTIDEALRQLLSGTGLTFRYIDDETVSIVPTATVPGVTSSSTGASGSYVAALDEPLASPRTDQNSKGFWQRLRLAQLEQGEAQNGAAASTGEPSESSDRIEEVVVTATRRSESTMRVPLSIAAINTEGLEKSNIKDMEDIATIVPGISYSAPMGVYTPSGARTSISIRGITAGGGDAVAGVYLDDVEITGVVPPVFDLERVEVLRGPQGTLFGAGAMGGAVRFIQKRPGLTEYSGRAVGEIGFVEGGGITKELGLALGGPLMQDRLGFRVSAWNRDQGGFIDRFNPITGVVIDEHANRSQSQVATAALTWAPVDALKVTPSIYWQDRRVHHSAGYEELISDPGSTRFQVGALYANPLRERVYIPSLTVEAGLGFADLISVTSMLRSKSYSEADLTPSFGPRLEPVYGISGGYGNPLHPAYAAQDSDFAMQTMPSRVENYSQEVRLSSSDANAPLTWTTGAYFSRAKQYSRVIWPEGEPGTPPIFGGFPYDESTTLVQKQLSGFAQADLRLFDGFKVTAGVRLARIETELSSQNELVVPPAPISETGRDTPVNPKFGVEYEINSRNMVYASAGKGFRAGGVNLAFANVPGCSAVVDPSYGPDSLWSYEIGTKNRLANDRLTISASAFQIKWSDRQTAINFQECGASATYNIGTAKVNGFDAAVSFSPGWGLRGDFSVAYIDSKFTQSIFEQIGAPTPEDPDAVIDRPVVLDGYSLSSAIAPWTFTASLEYAFQLRGHEAFIRAEDSYRSRNSGPFMFQAPTSTSYNADLSAEPAYDVLNLRAGVTLDNLQVTLFMTNALNAHPAQGRSNTLQGSDFWAASTIIPRTMGVNLGYKF